MAQQPLTANDLVYDVHRCPLCGDDVPIGCMSLCCTCQRCGTYYADAVEPEARGWYRNRAAYYAGEEKIR